MSDRNQKTKNRKQKSENRKRMGSGLQSLGGILDKFELEDKGGHISQEFQDYGYRLAMELNDKKHKSLYMRLAKREERGLLEKALSFVKDAGAKNPGALFMWKVKQLKEERSGGVGKG